MKVMVLSAERGRINLSIKKALPPPERPASRGPRPGGTEFRPVPHGAPRPKAAAPGGAPAARQQPIPPSGDAAFEDKLKRFLSTSEGKMADLNRGMDGKRGRRRR